MKDIRSTEQSTVVEKYIEQNPFRTTLVLSTGFGKSKVAIDILKRKKPKKILILVNSTILRDFSWRDEFKKFKALTIFKQNVEIVTYQLAYKWKKEDRDLTGYFIIADEVDFAGGTEELSKFFTEYSSVQVLGLTGFITDSKQEWFNANLPILTTLTANDAQKKGILNSIHYVFIKYDLSFIRDKVVTYKKYGVQKIFKQSENAAYDYANKKVHILQSEEAEINLDFMKGLITHLESVQKLNSLEYKVRLAQQKRSEILLESSASRTVAKKLISFIHSRNSESKIIVFSKRTAQSLEICGKDYTYNGKIPAKKRDDNYAKFLTGYNKLLGVCDKVDRGANIDGLNTAIFETFYGSDTKATQRFGRLMRLHPDEVATVYILLPYYLRKESNDTLTVQETQQCKWAASMLRSTHVKSHEVWDYRTVKTNKK